AARTLYARARRSRASKLCRRAASLRPDLALGLEELLEDERDGRARPLGDRDAARNLRRGRIASQPGPARTPAWRAASERSREQRAELRGRQVRPARQREVDGPGPRRRTREVGAGGLWRH